MDPDVAAMELQDCLNRGDGAGAAILADNLFTWINTGGFLPKLAKGYTRDGYSHLLMCIVNTFGDKA